MLRYAGAPSKVDWLCRVLREVKVNRRNVADATGGSQGTMRDLPGVTGSLS